VLQTTYHKKLFWLIGLSTLFRLFLAGFVELGNDEVYYWTYALYPDWSHFDHPPMVGLFIDLFSLNLLFQSTFFMRLSSVVLAAINTWLFYEIGKQLKDEHTGWYAALLYTASLYTSLIVGVFILPDTPQLFFWMLSLYVAVHILPDKDVVSSSKRKMLLLGLLIGFGMLSKYTSAFVWVAVGLYILFFNRAWLKSYSFYLAIILSLLMLTPVLYWNVQNDFISFTYQGERANIFNSSIRFDLLGTEIAGQFAYQNPFVFVLVWVAVWQAFFGKAFMERKKLALLLFFSLPMVFTFLLVALFRQTLPHWSGPAYLGLMLIGAAFLADRVKEKTHWVLKWALGLLSFIVVLGAAQIKYDVLHLNNKMPVDPTLDMYGWRQLNKKIRPVFEQDIAENKMPADAPILSWRWFPAAHLDFYVARKNNKVVKGIGSLERIHKYAWMNQKRGGFPLGMDAYFITFSTDFEDPNKKIATYFTSISSPDTIRIERRGEVVKEAYLYRLKNLVRQPHNELDTE